jgi:hypothetical protein
MKQRATNHEVLLFTGTNFSKKQFCNKDYRQLDNSLEDQLQRACWNGLIFEILQDILEHPSQKNSSFIWEVIPAENFIDVKIGVAPYSIEYAMSVNPYFFSMEKNFN